jgi:hypothetical protein
MKKRKSSLSLQAQRAALRCQDSRIDGDGARQTVRHPFVYQKRDSVEFHIQKTGAAIARRAPSAPMEKGSAFGERGQDGL